ncbi:putative b3 domain-containing protein [Quercus suber]|uniref:B3 domain-containing protein n=1 Tax=Quercus suber TaxID=58331 RepID=A0AAW0JSG0_QUESU|nr:putative b3 domain-containing protein [Quercus suber]
MEGFPRSSRPSFSGSSMAKQLLAALSPSSTPEQRNAAIAAMLSSTPEQRNAAIAAVLKRKSAMLPSVSSEVMTKNIATNGQMSLQRQPVFYDFLSAMEKRDRESQPRQAKLSKTNNQPELEEVSTDLKLGCGPCITQKRKSPENFATNVSLSYQASGIKRMKLKSDLEKEERHGGVSLKLKLGFDDPWVLRKRIEANYTNEQWFSIFLETVDAGKRILTASEQKRIEDAIITYGLEIPVVVWDFDTKSEHQLLMKQRTNGNNVIIEDWINEIVLRRGIKEGDEIGLFWDESNLRFNFSILKRNFSRESSLN